MAISIGSAVGSGFNVIGRRPVSAIAWGFFLYFSIVALLAIGVLVFGLSVIGKIATLRGGAADPTQTAQTMIDIFYGLWPALLIVAIGATFVSAMVQGAVYRTVLMPQDKGFFSLRFGGRELALVLLSLVIGFFVLLAYAVSAVLLGLIFYAASHYGGVIGTVFAVLFCIFYALAFMWFALRFSMAGPMTFAEGRVRFFGSWALTRGNGWGLFGLAWVMVLVIFGVSIGLGIVGGIVNAIFSGGVGAVLASSPDANSADASAQIAAHWPMLLLAALPTLLLNAVTQGLMQPITHAPWVDVYRQLHGAPDVSQTFT